MLLTGSARDVVVADQKRRSPGRVPVPEMSCSETTDRRRSPNAQPQADTAVHRPRRPRGRQTGHQRSSSPHLLDFTSSLFRGQFCVCFQVLLFLFLTTPVTGIEVSLWFIGAISTNMS